MIDNNIHQRDVSSTALLIIDHRPLVIVIADNRFGVQRNPANEKLYGYWAFAPTPITTRTITINCNTIL